LAPALNSVGGKTNESLAPKDEDESWHSRLGERGERGGGDH